jgi:hypothetical protein
MPDMSQFVWHITSCAVFSRKIYHFKMGLKRHCGTIKLRVIKICDMTYLP